jgi:hypothetical protein
LSLVTQFGGYTPEADLSDSDWTLKFNQNASATVRGIHLDYLTSGYSNSNTDTYTFDGVVDSSGSYVIAVAGFGDASGIEYLEIDGVLADEVITDVSGGLNIGLFYIEVSSMFDGDLTVMFNAANTSCAVAVWELFGEDSGTPSDTANAGLGTYGTLTVDTLSAIFGMSASDTPQADNHFWVGLNSDVEQAVDTDALVNAASVRKTFDGTSLTVGAEVSETVTNGQWLTASWDTPVTYFDSGQSALFEKQTSDAYTFWSWDQLLVTTNVEVLALVRPTAQSDYFRGGVFARGDGSVGSEDGYAFLLSQTAAGAMDQVTVLAFDNGLVTVVGTASFSWALDTNYWLKLKVRGTSIKARAWAQSSSEPTTWHINTSDSSVSAGGFGGVFHQYVSSSFEVGYFSLKALYDEWPTTVPKNWTVSMSGGPQANKVSFTPDTGKPITRRRSSSTTRTYRVEVPGLDQDEYLAFVDFFHTTLKEGTLPFQTDDPFSGEEKTFVFTDQDPSYEESIQRSPGEDYDDGLYKLAFSLTRID